MNFLSHFLIIATFVAIFLSTAIYPSSVLGQEITINTIAHVNSDNNTTWSHILPISNSNNYFLIDQQGNFYYSEDGEIDQSPFFASSSISNEHIQLTAVVLHPNFSLRDQIGFHTFYTAHIEPINTKRRYSRVQDTKAKLTHDVLITEWKTLNKTVDPESRREVIRIGVPSKQSHIKQLAFNPLTKSWHEEFGYLYIALNQDKAHQSLPLYSGAMLTIDPRRFGLRNYTVPKSNPFIGQNDIANELYAIGLHQFEQFIWPSKEHHSFLALHRYQEHQQLSLLKPRDDFRKIPPKTVLYVSENEIAPRSLFSYRGRELTDLWGMTLFTTKEQSQWVLNSLSMPNINEQSPKPIKQWQYNVQGTIDIAIFASNKDEALVFDPNSSIISQLSVAKSKIVKTLNDPTVASNNNNQSKNLYAILTVIFTLAIIGLIFVIRKKSLSARYIVNQQFSRLQITESKQHIALYRRHKKQAELELDISNVTLCTLTLNKNPLLTISTEHPMSNAIEIDVREKFNSERREKMISGRLRQLNVELTDRSSNVYPICAYLRKGDNRITRKKFGEIIEEILDWCWLLSQTVAQTEKRTHIPVQMPEKKVLLKPSVISGQSISQVELSTTSKESKPEQSTDSKPIVATELKSVQSSSTKEQPETIDTNLINALEKLAQLKEQGALTEDEFIQAKQKVMIGLLK